MQPQVQNLEQILAQLDPAYAGSKGLINQQLQAVPQQLQSVTTGLNQAKANAFRDINTNANARGVAFGGIPSGEQARYVGEKYLPALAQAQQGITSQQMTLQQALAQIEQDKYKSALGMQQTQQANVNDWQKMQQQQQFQAQQAQLDRQQQSSLAAASRSASASDNVDLKIVKNPNGGWTVLENGQPSQNFDLNGAARILGKNIVDLLRNGDSQDRAAANWYDQKVSRYGTQDSQKYLDELKRDRATAFYLGG